MDYDKMPIFIAHVDAENVEGAPTPETNDPATIVPNTDGFIIGGVQYYSKTKVDALLTAKESELKAWATSQFEPKTA